MKMMTICFHRGGGTGAALGGILVTGLLLTVIGAIVHRAGTGWIHALMPPAVMGTIVALIGLNLAGATTTAMQEVPVTTFGTALAPVTVTVRGVVDAGSWAVSCAVVCCAVSTPPSCPRSPAEDTPARRTAPA